MKNKITLRFRWTSIEVQIPSKWSEMDKKQLRECLTILSYKKKWPVTRIDLLVKLSEISKKSFNRIRAIVGDEYFFASVEAACAVCIDCLFKVSNDVVYPDFDFKQAPIDPSPRLLPFEGCFQNVTIYELVTILNKQESKSPNAKYELLATVFRKKKRATRYNKMRNYEGDKRIPLLWSYQEESVKFFKRQKNWQIDALVAWLDCVMNEFKAMYPMVFKTVKKAAGSGGKAQSYFDIILDLSGDKFGGLDKTAETNCHIVMAYLSKLEKERQQAERQQLTAS